VLKQTYRRITLTTGIVTKPVRYGVTSLPAEGGLDLIARFWRRHWSIENRVHYV
jgi:hypothetical protein